MGRISYTFYLIHLLFLEWIMALTANFLTSSGQLSRNEAAFWVFVIFTPIIIIVSWLMEIGIDTPSKNLAGEIDQELREQRRKDKDGNSIEPKSFWEFVSGNWKIWSLGLWFLLVFLTTHIYILMFV